MKKILAATLFVLLMIGTGWAADVVQEPAVRGYTAFPNNKDMRVATFTITADGSGNVAIFEFEQAQEIYGYYILSVEIKVAATDDAITVLIYTNNGATMFSKTTTAATTGEIHNCDDRWPINSAPKIDITDMAAAKIATVIVTFVR